MGFSNNLKNLCFRKEWDSNPCCITTNILSRDALSTAQPPFLYLLAAGLEPATHREQILSLPCLPISPSEQGLFVIANIFFGQRGIRTPGICIQLLSKQPLSTTQPFAHNFYPFD